MAEANILNPQRGYWAALNDNPNPSYGFTRKTNANTLLSRTRMGAWSQRDNANAGYSFPMSFMNRPWSTMLYLKQFYEIGKRGYFTYIDYDGGSRHHVGRFTSEPNPVQTSNGKYNCQNLIFEEVPQARMLTYPGDFGNWSATINVVDDSLRLAPSYQGAWFLMQRPGSTALTTDPASYQLLYETAGTGDFAQVQYVGFGFLMDFPLDANGGQCDIYLDGQRVVQALDLYSGSAAAVGAYSFINPLSPYVSLTLPALTSALVNLRSSLGVVEVSLTDVPLDAHRVKVVPLATRNEASGGYNVSFPAVQVIV